MATDKLTSSLDLDNISGALLDQVFEIKSLLTGAGSICAAEHGPAFGDIGRLLEMANTKADLLINELDDLQVA